MDHRGDSYQYIYIYIYISYIVKKRGEAGELQQQRRMGEGAMSGKEQRTRELSVVKDERFRQRQSSIT